MSMTVAIFDDDPRSIASVRALIEQEEQLGSDYSILTATSLAELQRILDEDTQIDILISDVITAEGEPSGIEVVQRLFPPESGTQVIFMSGFLEQAVEVYAADHVYFLLKPINPERLSDALAKALAAAAKRRPTMLRVKVGHKEYLVNAASISYLESSLHKVSVHSRARSYETYAKLDDLQAQLPPSFSRVHRSYLVNLAQVRALSETEVQLMDGTVLPVSRRRAHEAQHDLLAYVSSRS